MQIFIQKMLIDRYIYLKRVTPSVFPYIVKTDITRGPKLIVIIYNDDLFYVHTTAWLIFSGISKLKGHALKLTCGSDHSYQPF